VRERERAKHKTRVFFPFFFREGGERERKGRGRAVGALFSVVRILDPPLLLLEIIPRGCKWRIGIAF